VSVDSRRSSCTGLVLRANGRDVTSTQILEARQRARGAERFKRGKRAEERTKSRGRRKNSDLLQISWPLCSTQVTCSVWVCHRL
jgi:hypothetical protein